MLSFALLKSLLPFSDIKAIAIPVTCLVNDLRPLRTIFFITEQNAPQELCKNKTNPVMQNILSTAERAVKLKVFLDVYLPR